MPCRKRKDHGARAKAQISARKWGATNPKNHLNNTQGDTNGNRAARRAAERQK